MGLARNQRAGIRVLVLDPARTTDGTGEGRLGTRGEAPLIGRSSVTLAAVLEAEGVQILPAAAGDLAGLRAFCRREHPVVALLDATALPLTQRRQPNTSQGDMDEAGSAEGTAQVMAQLVGLHAAAPTLPILVLGSSTDDDHVVQMLAAGAATYVFAPCSPRVLAVRLRALTRSVARRQHPDWPRPSLRMQGVPLGNVWLDPETLEATIISAETTVARDSVMNGVAHRIARTPGDADANRRDRVVQLSPGEFRLLYLLATNPRMVVPADRLAEYAGVSRARHVISQMRARLGLPTRGPGAVQTHPGVGYSYQPPVRDA